MNFNVYVGDLKMKQGKRLPSKNQYFCSLHTKAVLLTFLEKCPDLKKHHPKDSKHSSLQVRSLLFVSQGKMEGKIESCILYGVKKTAKSKQIFIYQSKIQTSPLIH